MKEPQPGQELSCRGCQSGRLAEGRRVSAQRGNKGLTKKSGMSFVRAESGVLPHCGK